MKQLYSVRFLLLIVLVVLGLGSARAQTSITYTVSPTQVPYSFTVPFGASSMTVDLRGARGGYGMYSTSSNPLNRGNGSNGSGGEATGTMAVTGGQIFYVFVGDTGKPSSGPSTNNTTVNFGGFNGGAPGYGWGAGGGGASDIRFGGSALSNRIVVAGGGGGWGGAGGSSPYSTGGCGGALTGQAGYYSNFGTGTNSTTNAGQGGTQSGGGAKGTNPLASDQADGGFGVGGQGASNLSGGQAYGGGGGGGWYGGGGGVYGGGGGGSNYAAGSFTSVTNIQCFNDAPGTVTIYTDCTPAVAGKATGPAAVCAGSGSVTFANPTGSGGGTWSSSDPSVINFANPNSPVATVTGSLASKGNAPQAIVITNVIQYGCGGPASSNYTMTVNPLPNPILNGSSGPVGPICAGSTQLVQSSTPNGAWSTSNTNIATAVTLTGSLATVTGIAAGTSTITYALTTGCQTTVVQTVNPIPAGITPTTPVLVCQGSPAITFSDATPGGTWSTTAAYTITSGGVVSNTTAGTGSIVYTIPNSNGKNCSVSTPYTVEALPSNISLSPLGAFTRCSNGPGVAEQLPYTDNLVRYTLYKDGVQYAPTATGDGNALNFGAFTAAGTYSVVATSANGCVTNITGNVKIVVDTAPKGGTFHADGSTTFCQSPGSGVNFIIDNVEHGNAGMLSYQAILNGGGNAVGSPVTPTGSTASLGLFNQPGTYTIIASDPNSDGMTCSTQLTTSITLNSNPLPQVDDLTGGGNYCPGGAGVAVCMKNSVTGIKYDLYVNGGTLVDTKDGSTGVGFCFGPLGVGLVKPAGNYTVTETNKTTGCVNSANIPTPVVVGLYTPPTASIIEGGRTMCANDLTGSLVDIQTSQNTVNYQLYKDGIATGGLVPGNGSKLQLGAEYASGVYTAFGIDGNGCSTKMTGTTTVILEPIPTVEMVTGGGSYCLGPKNGNPVRVAATDPNASYIRILNGATAGTAQSGDPLGGGILWDDTLTGNFTVRAVQTNTADQCATMMNGSATVSVNALPQLYAVSGGGNYCIGNGGKNINMSHTGLGVNYQLFYIDGTAMSGAVAGSNAGIDFGNYTTVGDYYVTATNAVTTCTVIMTDTVTITKTAKPTPFAVTGTGSSYCFGNPGIDIMLSSSQAGVRYQFYRSGVVAAAPADGTGLTLDFGMQTLPGAYSITASDTTTGCSDTMFGKAVVVINALPSVYNVGGGGAYCAGDTGVHITINKSDAGISYELYNTGMPTGIVKAGTGGMVDFGAQTAAGNYTVMAVNPSTTCVNSMSGTVNVSINALPTPNTVSGGGDICLGSTGNNIALGNSEAGVSYRLYRNDTAIDIAIAGSGSLVNFGIHSAGGVYKIIGTRTATGCKAAMSNTTTINVNALPTAFTLSGASVSCAGATTVHITNSGSVIGVNYQLVNGSTPIGMYITGNSHSLDFGIPTTSGSYDVVATDALTGCTNRTIAPVNVVINALPGMQTMTGGGHYCIARSGAKVGLASSDAGINYQLYRGTTIASPLMPGGGYMIDFGYQKTAGTYTVMATNTTTGCAQKMTGSEDVIVDALTPAAVSIMTTGMSGDTVCAGATYSFMAMPVNGGVAPVYAWSVNGGPAVAYGNTYTYVPVNGDILGVTMTSNADCAVPPTVSTNKIISTVPYILPSVALNSDHGDHICAGTTVTYTAAPAADGYVQNYNWVINSKIDPTLAGKTSLSYAPANGDIIIFMLGSSYPCRLKDTVFSNTFEMTVDPGKTPVVNILASQGSKLAAGQSDTFTAVATNVGLSPTYQWYENGAPQVGETGNRYISNQFFDGDSVTCMVTSSGACGYVGRNSLVINITRSTGINGAGYTNADIRVMPNPSKGDFTIKGSLGIQADELVSLEITNMLGQVVYSNSINAVKGNIDQEVHMNNGIATGMYLLNIRSASGSNVYHIVVEQK